MLGGPARSRPCQQQGSRCECSDPPDADAGRFCLAPPCRRPACWSWRCRSIRPGQAGTRRPAHGRPRGRRDGKHQPDRDRHQIDQSTQRAAINWQSFDVGAAERDFQQPSAHAMTLNRVVGPDPSQIAGRINANGQIVLMNQVGGEFLPGRAGQHRRARSSPRRTSPTELHGRADGVRPAGRAGSADREPGHITVRDAGLAALVAPQVANSGVITARLGRVVLAGAKTMRWISMATGSFRSTSTAR